MQATHLSDEQFAAALEGTAHDVAAAHLAQCAACRAELERTRGGVRQLAAWSRGVAAHPAGFWYAQRQSIAGQAAGRREPSRLPVWAAAMAGMVMTALLLLQSPWRDADLQRGVQASVDPDDLLMREIQASLRSPVPRPFEPALLVTLELQRAAEEVEAQP